MRQRQEIQEVSRRSSLILSSRNARRRDEDHIWNSRRPTLTLSRDRHRHRHRADVRRRPAGAAALDRAAHTGGCVHQAHPQHRPESAAPQRGHGHGDRVRAGHCDGAARRPRRHSQEPVDPGAGVGSRPRQALRERHDRQPDHAVAVEPDLRGAGPDAEVPHLGRPDHRGRQQGRASRRHPDQPRPALRDQRAAADRRGDDEEPAVHRAGGHHA